jgi:hypothetical protein
VSTLPAIDKAAAPQAIAQILDDGATRLPGVVHPQTADQSLSVTILPEQLPGCTCRHPVVSSAERTVVLWLDVRENQREMEEVLDCKIDDRRQNRAHREEKLYA